MKEQLSMRPEGGDALDKKDGDDGDQHDDTSASARALGTSSTTVAAERPSCALCTSRDWDDRNASACVIA
jgi:hypothetical protein